MTERMVFFLGRKFASGLLCRSTLKPIIPTPPPKKKNLKNLGFSNPASYSVAIFVKLPITTVGGESPSVRTEAAWVFEAMQSVIALRPLTRCDRNTRSSDFPFTGIGHLRYSAALKYLQWAPTTQPTVDSQWRR